MSPHLRFVRKTLEEAGVDLQWTFERRILDHELPYPPLRKAVKATLGSREA